MTKKRYWLAAALAVAAGAVVSLDGRSRKEGATARPDPAPPVARHRPAPALSTWRTAMAGAVAVRERAPLAEVVDEEVESMTTAEVDAALEALVGDAESYWELSGDARAQYDRLVAQQTARRGLGTVPERMAPWREELTLDGEVLR